VSPLKCCADRPSPAPARLGLIRAEQQEPPPCPSGARSRTFPASPGVQHRGHRAGHRRRQGSGIRWNRRVSLFKVLWTGIRPKIVQTDLGAIAKQSPYGIRAIQFGSFQSMWEMPQLRTLTARFTDGRRISDPRYRSSALDRSRRSNSYLIPPSSAGNMTMYTQPTTFRNHSRHKRWPYAFLSGS
jgi:hypothetical protein